MKRFLLFAFDQYYPSGGWLDFRDSYDTAFEAGEAGRALNRDWFQVIDGATGSDMTGLQEAKK